MANSIKDLKAASYNPRFITDKQLNQLRTSIETFGDLSGVVFNIATKTLVSGHQRIKTLKGKNTKIVKKPAKDKTGTVAIGHIEVAEKNGNVIKIPYREVNWTDRKVEMAANIGANAHGGDFDQVKLGGLLHKLEQGKFDVELTGVDNFDLQKAIGKFKKSKVGVEVAHKAGVREVEEAVGGGKKSKNGKKDKHDETKSFQTFKGKDFEFKHCCPRCKYKWND